MFVAQCFCKQLTTQLQTFIFLIQLCSINKMISVFNLFLKNWEMIQSLLQKLVKTASHLKLYNTQSTFFFKKNVFVSMQISLQKNFKSLQRLLNIGHVSCFHVGCFVLRRTYL